DDADNISLAESNTMSAMTASTPYSGSPILVVMDIALTVAEDEAAALVVELARVDDTVLAVVLASVDETTALVVAADTVVADTVVAADTVVDEITLVSIFSYHSVNVNSRNEICVFGN
ncbi:MAG: hypothetical protein M8353_08895, partial [ANME-2 cluster archaeon]|nr:hypothetical protein [ANME-2 cluster archaeon]